MKSRRVPMPNLFISILVLISIYQVTIGYSQKVDDPNSASLSCGSQLHDIRYPFYKAISSTYPYEFQNTFYPYAVSCLDNHTVLHSSWDERYLYVEAINYQNYTIRVSDPNVQKDNCSSTSIYPLTKDYIKRHYLLETEIRFSHAREVRDVRKLSQTVTVLSCEKPMENSPLRDYIKLAPCINGSAPSQHRRRHSYAVVDSNLTFSDLEEACHIDQIVLISTRKGNIAKNVTSYRDIHNELANGIEFSWVNHAGPNSYSYDRYHEAENDFCNVDENSNEVQCTDDPYIDPYPDAGITSDVQTCGFSCDFMYYAEVFLGKARVCIEILSAPRILCAIIVIALLIYKWRRRHLSVYDSIEEFLQSADNNLMPIRYSYWEIRMMTRNFKDKLGEGGFGSVYKGTLSSGRFVAIKMLNKSKANGQDFINEVSTIGRIHHVNVVQLIGFCVSGSKRGLVYDFMPNGSLDKYIFSRDGISTKSLSHKEIFEISLGVARGIQYLHQGCDVQILHFDIKPHNILLDENFVPKVSDFGLARLCPLNNSIVSVTMARGTLGYIAPELFYKNIGGVSYKADVYSFGMLLMEMANKRKNLNANTENSSQIYFPLWVYDQFIKGKEMEIEDAAEEELKMIKKMIIVALWCIQLKPCDRPSMNKVIEMLEGEVESLEMPPKPCLYPQEQEQEKRSGEDAEETSCSSTLSMEGAP